MEPRVLVRLAIQMAEKGGVYVLDEPTSGLHLADVEQLLHLLDRIVDSGKSVIVMGDNDKAGINHATAVCKSIAPYAPIAAPT